jgi:hypothetical protein
MLGDAYKDGVLELNASDERYRASLCHLSLFDLPPEESTLCGIKSSLSHRRRSPFLPGGTKS